MISDLQIQQLTSLLQGKTNILIFTHVAPDGDAMGSALGLQHWLNHNIEGIAEVNVVVPTPFPPFLAWMPGADKVLINTLHEAEIQAAASRADLAFCLDFGEPKRVDALEGTLSALTCHKIVIDHHTSPDEQMADLVISYPAAPATCFLMLDLFNKLPIPGAQIPYETAVAIYTGLMTDTGNFAFNSNNPELYEMIAQLLRAGINKDEIFDNVFNQYSVDILRFMGYCLYHKMRIFPKYHTALIALSSDELRRFNFQSGDAEGIVNMPLQIGAIKYSVFIREDVDKIKMSFRSQGNRPVNEFAREVFNGGGHVNAAGGESHLSLAATVKLFEDNYQHFFKRD